MRPPRDDIAAPPFPPGTEWVGAEAPRLERLLAAGPLLVHFFELSQLNSVRALPYVAGWRRRYRGDGLEVLGVHSPRFPFSRDTATVEATLPTLGIEWPVACDPRHAIWRDYGCRGWPSIFLWSRGGALRWYHLGEGEYEATEAAIREALQEAGREPPPPQPFVPLRPEDAAGAAVVAPSPEYFPAGSPERPWSGGEALELSYEGGGAYLAAAGRGEVGVTLDGRALDPVAIEGPGLHRVIAHDHHERHRLGLRMPAGVELYSVQFPPAPPG